MQCPRVLWIRGPLSHLKPVGDQTSSPWVTSPLDSGKGPIRRGDRSGLGRCSVCQPRLARCGRRILPKGKSTSMRTTVAGIGFERAGVSEVKPFYKKAPRSLVMSARHRALRGWEGGGGSGTPRPVQPTEHRALVKELGIQSKQDSRRPNQRLQSGRVERRKATMKQCDPATSCPKGRY